MCSSTMDEAATSKRRRLLKRALRLPCWDLQSARPRALLAQRPLHHPRRAHGSCHPCLLTYADPPCVRPRPHNIEHTFLFGLT